MGQASSPVARLRRGWFYTGAAALFLIPILLGFQQYIFAGKQLAEVLSMRLRHHRSALSQAAPRPSVNSIFGSHTWTALSGPVVALGALLLLVRSLITRRLDREFASAMPPSLW